MSKDEFRVDDWSAFVGQTALKNRLSTHISASIESGRALPHILLSGPPGFGKTSLATLIADELGAEFDAFVCPITERTLYNIAIGNYAQVILLDEIHRMSKKEQERLLPLIEDGTLHLSTGVVVDIDPTVTIVAATTERDKVIAPLYDRFAIKPEFEDYTDAELREIVITMSHIACIPVPDHVAEAFGKAAGGVPRNARQLLVALRDYRLAFDKEPTVEDVLTLCQLDENGLSPLHLRYLEYLRSNGTTGVTTLATILNIPAGAVLALERTLLRAGLICYTKRGRELTGSGLKYGSRSGTSGPRVLSNRP